MKINGKPDGGGGGGVIAALSATENGIYIATGGVDGYSPVEVDVQPSLQSKSTSENGTITPDEGYYGLSTVTVNVPDIPAVTESLTVSVNNTYYPGQGVDGFSMVVVDVPQSVTGFTQKDITEGVQITDLNNSASYVHSFVYGKNTYLQTVNLPNCTRVYEQAFAQCTNLTTVSLPICKIIDNQAFMRSPNINIYAPECISVGYGAFNSCNYLLSINLPKCTRIDNEVFNYCYWLSEVNLPECTYIGLNTFYSCVRLQSINIEKCLELGQNVFGGASYSLSSLNLPVISKIGQNAFMGCSNLSQLTLCTETYKIPSYYANIFTNTPFIQGIGSIYVDATLYDTFISSTGWSSFSSLFVSVGTSDPMLSFSDGLLYGKTTNIYANWKDYVSTTSSLLTKLSLSECNILNVQTFMNCINLSEVDLPKCSTIMSSAFYNCAALTSIDLPEVVSIYYKAFFSCNNLEEVDLHSCGYIGESAFNWLTKLSKVTFRGSTVCGLYNSSVFSQYNKQTPLVSFFVPASLVDAYKADVNWSWYSSRIFPIPEP